MPGALEVNVSELPESPPRWSFAEPSPVTDLLTKAGDSLEYFVLKHNCQHLKIEAAACAVCEAKLTLWQIEERERASRSATGPGSVV